MKKSICLATVDFEGPVKVGGIGSHFSEIAKLLSNNGWDVTVLFHNEVVNIHNFAEEYYRSHRVRILDALEVAKESDARIDKVITDAHPHQSRSYVFNAALEVLQQKYRKRFDLVEFSEWGGVGFIPIQKKLSLPTNWRAIVRLHSPTEWAYEGAQNREWNSSDDVKMEYYEQYAFENADIQTSQTRHLLNWCRERGWKVRPDASICPAPVSVPQFDEVNSVKPDSRNELVFFGRFEERKGVLEFIDSLVYLDSIDKSFASRYNITFIGKEGTTISRQDIEQRLDNYQLKFLTTSRKQEAVRYLKENARLVVLPSRLDNYPSTVLECMLSRVLFVTSRAGGIPEILEPGSRIYDSLSCDTTNSKNLAHLIQRVLALGRSTVDKLIDQSYDRARVVTDPNIILQWYTDSLEKTLSYESNLSAASNPNESVSVVIPTRNMSKYLDTTLTSLLNQSYKNFKIVIKDSSTETEEIEYLLQLRERHRDKVTLIQMADTCLGNALNQALVHVDTEFIIQVDADNILRPHMIEMLLRSIKNRPSLAALSCYFGGFIDDQEHGILHMQGGEVYHCLSNYTPMGPCLPLIFLENTQGDSNSIYRTSVLKSIGGWPENRGHPDRCLWLKLLARGYEMDVVPELLYYHRNRPQSGITEVNAYWSNEPNIPIIRELIENRPEFFSSYYRHYHRLLLERYGTQELELYKKTALYALNQKFRTIAQRSTKARRLLELSGRAIKAVSST